MRGFLLICIIIFSIPNFTFGQAEANTWYFGKNAGIDFSSGSPEVLKNSALNTEEGCASISDKDGNLLFYTDGLSVWNRLHQHMPNGSGLLGNPSSTQSGVIIPNLNHKGLYYIFTIADQGNEDGFRYSVLDMSKANGMGDIIEKNVLLATPVTEKITAVKHRNNKDIWVITHGWKSNEFLAFLVTKEGVSKQPVSTKEGKIHQGSTTNTQGYMKSSPDGTNLALAIEIDNQVEIFDFDNESGKVSNPITLTLSKGSYPYGIEFSANGSLLYVSAAGTGKIYQYNLQAGSDANIISSKTIVGSTLNGKWIGALQIAVDGKIYFPIYGTSFLGTIHQPNTLGRDCLYQNNAVFLDSGVSQLGLPSFTQSFFEHQVEEDTIEFFSEKNISLNKSLIIDNLLFETNAAKIQEQSFSELEKIANTLKTNPRLTIEISGHTDNIGNKSYNIKLSEKRAAAVAQFLVSKGINVTRISSMGFGSSQPIRNNKTPEGRKLNRRVELVLKSEVE